MTEGSATIRPLGRPGDLGWVIQAHGEVYATEFGWDQTFEALVARIVADYASDRERACERTMGIVRRDPRAEAAWIAEVDDRRVGCVFCVRESDDVAKLRILLVDPVARGRRLGDDLVRTCIDFARGRGYRRLALWTNRSLGAARRIYLRQGFRCTAEEEHHSFGHVLIGQTYVRDLEP